MCPKIELDRAKPCRADATALRQVEAATLGDSDYTVDEIVNLLARPEQRIYLAQTAEQCVGFCACFETLLDGQHQLEIDMLGVMPDWRRRGIATQLIANAMKEAKERDVSAFRAVVAQDNVASQRAFQKAGLTAQETPRHLMVYHIRGLQPVDDLPQGWRAALSKGQPAEIKETDPNPFEPRAEQLEILDPDDRLVGRARWLRVHTLSYKGLWLEELWSASSKALSILLREAVEHAKHSCLDQVGHLLPVSHRTMRYTFFAGGFSEIGEYYVYGVPLS